MDILEERAKTHGDFETTADIAQALKGVVSDYYQPTSMTAVQVEVLDRICTKIARIMSGNPDEIDHWRDISGYAELAVKDLEAEPSAGD